MEWIVSRAAANIATHTIGPENSVCRKEEKKKKGLRPMVGWVARWGGGSGGDSLGRVFLVSLLEKRLWFCASGCAGTHFKACSSARRRVYKVFKVVGRGKIIFGELKTKQERTKSKRQRIASSPAVKATTKLQPGR